MCTESDEATIGQKVEHCLALGELHHARGEVTVGVMVVGRERLANPRQDVSKEEEVKAAEDWSLRRRELQDGYLAARTCHANHLIDPENGIGYVPQAEGHADNSESIARQRQ